MNFFKEIKVPLRQKSGKKLLSFTVFVSVVLIVVIFLALVALTCSGYMKLLDQYIREVPAIVTSREKEFDTRSRIFEEDVKARGELGLKAYEEAGKLSDAEKLELVRSMVDAASVSLTDGNGQLLASTDPTAGESLAAYLTTLEPRTPILKLFKSGESSDFALVALPLTGEANRNLVFEFPCGTIAQLYNALSDWPGILERMLSGANGYGFDGYGFVRLGGDMIQGYPLDELAPEQREALLGEARGVFADQSGFRPLGGQTPAKLISLQGRRFVAVMMPYPEADAEVLLAVPLSTVVGSSVFCAVALSLFAILALFLFLVYALHRVPQGKDGESRQALHKRVRQTARPGLIILLIATVCFSLMLLLLDNESTTSYIAMSKRMSLQSEILWHEAQDGIIRKSHADIYQGRSRALARFLTEHPEYRTFDGLKQLSDLTCTDYLMLFDKDGQETVSSNSYVGFSVGTTISEDYRAVLLGYPSATDGPSADPYTNQMQFGTATLLTDHAGHPDGFLLSVVSADSLYRELESVNLQNTVNNFAVQKGCYAAVVDSESGLFVAHTDPNMVGQFAERYLDEKVLGVSFEGFADYDGESMYISSFTENGKDLLFMAPQIPDTDAQTILALMLLALVLILALVFYPNACALCADTMEEAGFRLPDGENPLLIFAKGFVVYFTLLAVFAFICSVKDYWSSFDFVFSHQWSKGFHLFSLWAALFIGSITMFVMFALREVLGALEEHLSLRSKTITRLANSVVNYTCSIFLVFYILTLLGVNTAALLASAGIISIAVGMGAQSMASDILAGFFMMLEGSIHVGDYVSVGGMTGYVTDMGIRTTEITDENANVVILNNSHVSNVVNMSRNHPEKNAEAALKEVLKQ